MIVIIRYSFSQFYKGLHGLVFRKPSYFYQTKKAPSKSMCLEYKLYTPRPPARWPFWKFQNMFLSERLVFDLCFQRLENCSLREFVTDFLGGCPTASMLNYGIQTQVCLQGCARFASKVPLHLSCIYQCLLFILRIKARCFSLFTLLFFYSFLPHFEM